MINKKVMYWSDIEEMVHKLVTKIEKSDQNFDRILCLARGGLVPAALLAHKLDIRDVHSVAITSYYNKEQFDPEVRTALPDIDGAGLLVVDDLVDTGKTIDFIKNHYPHAKVACLLSKPEGHDRADFVGREMKDNQWINFPWEEDKKSAEKKKIA